MKLVYIASYSRSGSTVLDIVLGNHPDICGAGELFRLMTSGWQGKQPCSCGVPVPDCPFWGRVVERWRAETGAEPAAYAALQDKFERLRRLPLLLAGRAQKTPEFRTYAEQTLALLRAVQEVSGREVVVDSSKSPVRALALGYIEGIDLRLIHLVRDARAVAWSLARSYRKDAESGIEKDIPGIAPMRTVLEWRFLNGLIQRLRLKNYILLRYEDLTANPAQTAERLAKFAECDPRPFLDCVKKDEFITGHKAAGNRLRMQKRISLRHDRKWHDDMPVEKRKLVTVLSTGMLKRYGYGEV